RRLAERLEVLHRVPEVSLDRSTKQLLRDTGKEAHWQVVVDLDGAIRAAPGLRLGDRHCSLGAPRASELQRVGMWLVGLRRLLGAFDLSAEDPRDRRNPCRYSVQPVGAVPDLDDVGVPLREPLTRGVEFPDLIDGRVDVLALRSARRAPLTGSAWASHPAGPRYQSTPGDQRLQDWLR